MHLSRGPLALLVSCVVTLGACHGCDDKTQVPFKRGEGQLAGGRDGGSAAAATTSATPDGQKTLAAAYSEGSVRVVVEGAGAERTQGSFRASLAVDLDGDGVRDALFLATDAQGRPRLETGLRKGDKLALGAAVMLVPAAVSCSMGDAKLSSLGETMALVTSTLTCVTKNEAAKTAPLNTPPPSGEPRQHFFVVSRESSPRLLLHVALRAPEPLATEKLGISLGSEDRDGDEHPDVRLDVDLEAPGGPPRRLSIVWLDRPSGLARDGSEPEHTLDALATEGSDTLSKNPDQSLAVADLALGLHERICRESGHAQLEIDDEPGALCGASAAAGRAAVLRLAALSRKHALLPALYAYAALEQPGYRIDDVQRKRAERALATLPGDTEFVWQRGPALHAPTDPPVRLPAIGWSDEEHLLLRGTIAQSYELATQTLTPVALSGSLLVSDPKAGATVVDVVRTCDGRRLRVVPSAQMLDGFGAALPPLTAASAATGPRIETAIVSADSCNESRVVRSDRSGITVLGASAQGIVVARAETLLLAPLGSPDAEPHELAPAEPSPQLLTPGAVSADGTRYALATSQGVVLVARGLISSARLVRTPPSCTATPSDAALSPSGLRVAMICGDQVYVAARPSAAPATAPAPSPIPASPANAAPPPAAPVPPPPVPVTALPPPAPEPPSSARP